MRVLRHVLHIEKEEGLVLDQRTAQLAAEIRTPKRQILPARSFRKRNALVAKQSERFPVKARASRPGPHIHFARRGRSHGNIQHRAVDEHLVDRTQGNVLGGPAFVFIAEFNAIQRVQSVRPAELVDRRGERPRLRRVQRPPILDQTLPAEIAPYSEHRVH